MSANTATEGNFGRNYLSRVKNRMNLNGLQYMFLCLNFEITLKYNTFFFLHFCKKVLNVSTTFQPF